MRRRYQEGGGVRRGFGLDALEEELINDVPFTAATAGSEGALDPASMLMSVFAQQYTTTPEAQKRAREILDKVMSGDRSAWDTILQGKRDQAEQVRQALRTARDRLNSQEFGRSELLLAIGQGLGAPTKTGAIGETASNVATTAADPARRFREWEEGRDRSLSELDLAEARVNENVYDAEFELNKLREAIEGRLAVEAMDTLGKTTMGGGAWRGPIPKAVEALDAEYAKTYHLPFVSGGGRELAAAGLNRLRFVKDVLERGSDALTGPYIGAVANLPGVGRWLQAAIVPGSADLRDILERTIQEDLRPTLGSQFTEREGENLINRSFNVSLEEKDNLPRVSQLIEQMEAVYANKEAMANYFEENQTLFGYQNPRAGYTSNDFKFSDEASSTPRVRFQDLPPREQDVQRRIWEERNGRPAPFKKGGRVRKRRGYQEGGVIFPNEEQSNVIFPGEEEESSLLQDIAALKDDYGSPVAIGAGAGLGLLGESALDTLAQRMVGGTERRVADAISSGGLDPIATAQDIGRNQRAGVPDTLMDTDTAGIRALAQEAFTFGDAPAEAALRELRNRLEGSRERVNERINTGLKPYEYFAYDDKLARQLEGPRAAEMRSAFEKYKAVPVDPVLSEILNTPEGKRAIEWAFKFYENSPGRSPGKVDREGMLLAPSLEFYDYVRKGFNQTIAREEARGKTEFGGVLRDLRQTYLDRLDEVAPEYRVARESQGDDLDIRDSLASGREFMSLQPEQLAELAKKQNFHQRNAFRTGMAQHLYEMLDKASGENYNAAQRIAGSPAMLARLEPFFDSPHQFEVFQTALERESDLMRIGRQRLKDGETGRMTREARRQSPFEYVAQRGPGFRFSISPVGWALRIFRDMPKMTPNEAKEVISLLRRGSPEEMNNFVRKIRRLKTLRSTRWGRRGAAAALGAGAGALLTGGEE